MRQPGSEFEGHVDLSYFLATVDPDLFFTYSGSLTTPPCSEVVTWTIFAEPILINYQQVVCDKFISN